MMECGLIPLLAEQILLPQPYLEIEAVIAGHGQLLKAMQMLLAQEIVPD